MQGREHMTIRLIKALIALSVGLWGVIGLVGNLAGLSQTYEAVEAVTSMANVPEGVGPPWRTSSTLVVSLGAAVIVFGKLAAVIAGFGAVSMLGSLGKTPEEFHRAKYWAVAGCGLAFALMFLGFTVMAESAFFMFYTPEGGAGQLAFRFSASFALAALFISQRDSDL